MLDKLKSFFGKPPAQPANFQEAAGTTINDDEEGWSRLTGDSNRDLSPLTQKRQQALAAYLWGANPLGNRLIELPVAYLLAEGVELTVEDEEAKDWLKAFWKDPINNMDIKLPKKVRELALYGEQCWPVFVNSLNGHVRLGYLDPALIAKVVPDPDNKEQPIGIIANMDKKGRQRRYRIIINGPENVFSRRTQEIRQSFTDGDCFYFCVNDLSNATRGHSDLLPVMDWLDAYDEALYGELDRWDHLRSFIWDVTLKGATQDEVDRRTAQIVVPSAGGIRVHNEAEEWKTETPDLQAANGGEFARLFRNHILGGLTVPEHWYGGGGDVNRSTSESMDEPTAKIMSMRQKYWQYILETLGQYQVRQRLKAILGTDGEAELDDSYTVKAVFPEMIVKDSTAYAGALQQVVLAASTAVERGLLSVDGATRLICFVAARLGVELDAEAELASAAELMGGTGLENEDYEQAANE